VAPLFTYSGDVVHHDLRDDVGECRLTFEQTEDEMKAILNYLVGSGRSAAFTFPSLGIPYPFGVSRGAGPFSCRATEFSVTRKSLNRWGLTVKFVEEIS
jgi:hypothetical protein